MKHYLPIRPPLEAKVSKAKRFCSYVEAFKAMSSSTNTTSTCAFHLAPT